MGISKSDNFNISARKPTRDGAMKIVGNVPTSYADITEFLSTVVVTVTQAGQFKRSEGVPYSIMKNTVPTWYEFVGGVADINLQEMVTASKLGLGNVNNTSDSAKPVSTVQQTALNTVASNAASSLASHTGNTSNPHNTTKSQIGLGNVDNTSDLNKPISTAVQEVFDSFDEQLQVIAFSSEMHMNGATKNVGEVHLTADAALIIDSPVNGRIYIIDLYHDNPGTTLTVYGNVADAVTGQSSGDNEYDTLVARCKNGILNWAIQTYGTVSAPPPTGGDLEAATISPVSHASFVQTGSDWGSSTTGAVYGVATKKIAAGTNGYFQAKYASSLNDGAVIGLDGSDTLEYYSEASDFTPPNAVKYNYTLYPWGGVYYSGQVGEAIQSGIPAAIGDLYRIRVESAIAIAEKSSNNGDSWTAIRTFETAVPGGTDMFGKVTSVVAGNKISEIKTFNAVAV